MTGKPAHRPIDFSTCYNENNNRAEEKFLCKVKEFLVFWFFIQGIVFYGLI